MTGLHYSVYQHLPATALSLMAWFAIGVTLFGLALDLLTLFLYLNKKKNAARSSVGLPFVPWLFYFLASFLWFLRGSNGLAIVLLAVLTAWHLGLHFAIYRAVQQRLAHGKTS